MKDCQSGTNVDVIAIHGKTVGSSYDKSPIHGSIHMVSAFSTAN